MSAEVGLEQQSLASTIFVVELVFILYKYKGYPKSKFP